MQPNNTASAFGLFYLAFANLEQQLAAAVFYIRRIKEPNLMFEEVFKLRFSTLRKALNVALRQFDAQPSTEVDLQYLRHFDEKVAALSIWRNDRAHHGCGWTKLVSQSITGEPANG